MTGMEAAKKLRKTNTDCLLFFTTTSTDHALEGFQVRALHYLVKPFTEADIDALTDELLARIPQPDKYIKKIIIHAPDKSDGKRRQKVEIIFNFVDEVEIPVLAEPMIAESTLGRRKTA